MPELQIAFFFALLGIALSFAKHSLLEGFGLAAGGLVAFFGGLLALSWAISKAAEMTDGPRLAPVRAAAVGLAAAVAGAAFGGFLAIFAAPRLAATPEGQLLAMRSISGGLGLLCGGWAFAAVRRRQRASGTLVE